jgi:thiamine monophosphate kinase
MALTLADANEVLVHAIAHAMHEHCSEHRIAIVGGDTTSGDQSLLIFLNALKHP